MDRVTGYPKPTRKKRKNHVRRKITSARRQMEIRADYLCKVLVHHRDGDKCLKCGGDEQLQAAHILPKGKYPTMRHVTDNLLSLCWRDHMEWAHKDPVGFVDWVNAKWPELLERLRISARMTRLLDLKELLIVLEAEVSALGGEANNG